MYVCCNSHVREWKSQPLIRGTLVGNVLLGGSIIVFGGFPNRLSLALQSINIAGICPRTFFRHQSKYLTDVVDNVWFLRHNTLMSYREVGC